MPDPVVILKAMSMAAALAAVILGIFGWRGRTWTTCLAQRRLGSQRRRWVLSRLLGARNLASLASA